MEILVITLRFKFLKCVALSVFSVLLILCGCRSTSVVSAGDDSGAAIDAQTADYEDLALFTEALLLINRYYVEESDFTGLVYSAINGMVNDLDPHSSFLAPESLKSLDESTSGSFVGIGVNVESDSDGVKVIAPLKGSPALKAGIKAGDTITAVNGKSLEGVTLGEAVEKMRGEAGTAIEVTVERANGDHEQVELVRDAVKLTSVESCRMLDDETGFLRVRQFTSSTPSEVQDGLRSLEKQGVQKMILDLRDNPGGVLSSAVEVSGFFLERGKLIVSLKSRTGDDREREYKSGWGYKFPDLPLVVLVNRGSASASEVVAGALRDNQRAVLVGSRTYGKASVQSVIKMSLRPECALKLTTGYYYTPDGELIHGRGIPPDEEVYLSPEQHRQVQQFYMRNVYGSDKLPLPEADVQLAKAQEVLNQNRSAGDEL